MSKWLKKRLLRAFRGPKIKATLIHRLTELKDMVEGQDEMTILGNSSGWNI